MSMHLRIHTNFICFKGQNARKFLNFLVGVLFGISGAKSHNRSQVGAIRGPNACLWALGSLVFATKKLRCTYIGQDWVGEGIGRVGSHHLFHGRGPGNFWVDTRFSTPHKDPSAHKQALGPRIGPTWLPHSTATPLHRHPNPPLHLTPPNPTRYMKDTD